MKTLIKSLVLAAAMLVSAQSFAWQATDSAVPGYLENGWYGEVFTIRVPGNTVSTGCATGNETFAVQSSHPAFKTIVNVALAAYVAKRKIQIVFDPGQCIPYSGTIVTSVRMFD
ncbi:MAG TPA: hypothetical protein VM847_06175 [Tahibacter sp.]|nr:hypothetical protein [Tahibacter sp.]